MTGDPWGEYRLDAVAELREAAYRARTRDKSPQAAVVGSWQVKVESIRNDATIAGAAEIGQLAALARALDDVLRELVDQGPTSVDEAVLVVGVVVKRARDRIQAGESAGTVLRELLDGLDAVLAEHGDGSDE